ncbi:hypothetical protein [Streptomyces sp. NPDC003688]
MTQDAAHRHAGLAGVLIVLRTGVAWRDVPAEPVGCSRVLAGPGKVRQVVERAFAWLHQNLIPK